MARSAQDVRFTPDCVAKLYFLFRGVWAVGLVVAFSRSPIGEPAGSAYLSHQF
jgi:hypothetical protein